MVLRVAETVPEPYWTAAMARELPDDGNRYEVVYGELLVTPAPRYTHQHLIMGLISGLLPYLAREPVGEVLAAPADISFGPDVLLQPDVFVVPMDQARAQEWTAVRNLLLAVEVLSPSSQRQDRFLKRRRYQEAGVPCYWIVDGEARQVEVWTPSDLFPAVERERLTWHPAGAATALSLELRDLFGDG